MTLSERIEARKQQPNPELRRPPEWVRRADEGKLPAKDMTR